MSSAILTLVLSAAFLHAIWNAILKGTEDKSWSMTVMGGAVALAALPIAALAGAPAPASWPYLMASVVLHVLYNIVLARAYRTGEFSITYPIARGSAPLLVSLGAAVASNEHLGLKTLTGVLLVSLGIFYLGFRKENIGKANIAYALGTGALIGAYTVTDGLGVRHSGDAISYTSWMCFGWGALALPIWLIKNPHSAFWRGARPTITASGGGVVSFGAYGVVLYSMMHAPMGAISALRETSVLFAVIIGRVTFGEELSLPKCLAVVTILLGVICLK